MKIEILESTMLNEKKSGSNVLSLRKNMLESKFASTGYIVISASRGEWDDTHNSKRSKLLEQYIRERGYVYVKVMGGYQETPTNEAINTPSLKKDKYSKYSKYYNQYGGKNSFPDKYIQGIEDPENIRKEMPDDEELEKITEYFEISFVIQNKKNINKTHKGKKVSNDFQELFDFGKRMCKWFQQESFLVREPTDIRYFSTITPDIFNAEEEHWEDIDGEKHQVITKPDFKSKRYPAYYVNSLGRVVYKFSHFRENQIRQQYFTSLILTPNYTNFLKKVEEYDKYGKGKKRDIGDIGEIPDRPNIKYWTAKQSKDHIIANYKGLPKILRFTFFD